MGSVPEVMVTVLDLHRTIWHFRHHYIRRDTEWQTCSPVLYYIFRTGSLRHSCNHSQSNLPEQRLAPHFLL